MKKSSMAIFLSQVFNAIIALLGFTYIGRITGAETLGKFLFLFAVATGINVFITLGINEAIIKKISELKNQNKFISAAIIIKITTGIIFIIVAFLLQGLVYKYFDKNIFLYLIIFVFLIDLFEFFLNVLIAKQRMLIASLSITSLTLVNYAVATFLVYLGFGLYGIIYGFTLGYIITVLIEIIFSKIQFYLPTKTEFKSLISFAMWNFISRIGISGAEWIPIIIIGTLLSNSAVGIFGAAWKVSSLASLPLNAIGSVIFPVISEEWHNKKQKYSIENIAKKAFSAVTIIPIGMIFGALFLSKEIMEFGFGAEFAIGGSILTTLLIGRFIYTISGIYNRIMVAINEPRYASFISLIIFFVITIIGYLLTSHYALDGIVLSFVIAYAISVVLYKITIRKFIKIDFPFQKIFLYLISGIIMSLILFIIKDSIINISNLYSLLLIVFLGAIIYLIFLSFIYRKNISKQKIYGFFKLNK